MPRRLELRRRPPCPCRQSCLPGGRGGGSLRSPRWHTLVRRPPCLHLGAACDEEKHVLPRRRHQRPRQQRHRKGDCPALSSRRGAARCMHDSGGQLVTGRGALRRERARQPAGQARRESGSTFFRRDGLGRVKTLGRQTAATAVLVAGGQAQHKNLERDYSTIPP